MLNHYNLFIYNIPLYSKKKFWKKFQKIKVFIIKENYYEK